MVVNPACVRFTVFPLVIVAMVLLVLCVLSWMHVAEQRRYATFDEVPGCTVISSSAQQRSGGANHDFRSEFQVRVPEETGDRRTALRYISGIYNVTESAALEFNALFEIGSTFTCYQNAQDRALVSVVPVTEWDAPVDNVPTAVVVTVFCVTATGVLLATLAVISIVKPSGDEDSQREAQADDLESALAHPPAPVVHKTRGETLARDEIYTICDNYQVAPPEDPDACAEWTCAICLEDYSSEHKRLVKLPCEHQFHRRCIRGWLKRGGQTCCLCNTPLRTFLVSSATPPSAQSPPSLSPAGSDLARQRSAAPVATEPRDSSDLV
mmetsp:Transcript_5925/g.15740  ORF Transcript_5925/g.15740 Transcript_5925/m.15740 type:complete len:324 (+) Transcript_5925:179-1150(+)